MKTYGFTLVVDTNQQDFETVAENLYAAGCDDSLFGESNGIPSIDFDREAETLEEAVSSAIQAVESIGLTIVEVMSEERNFCFDDFCAEIPFICYPPICWLPAPCAQCGKLVEETRQCYAIPTCYACLPPPPLEILCTTLDDK